MKRTVEATDLAGAARRMLRALVRRAGEGDVFALEELGKLEHEIPDLLGAAARGFRAFEPTYGAERFSWADVAAALGTTRQNAFQRFGRET